MWKVLAGIIIVGTALAALKLAIVLLVLAGLIFRTKETLGVMALFGGWSLLAAHPVAGMGVGCLLLVLALCATRNKPDRGAS